MKADEALEAARSALGLMETLGGNYKLALALRAMAFTQAVVGNTEEAISRFQQAQDLSETIGDKQLQASVQLAGSLVHRVKTWGCKNASKPYGDSQDQAIGLARQAMGLYQQLENHESAELTRIELAQAMMLAGDLDEAVKHAFTARDF